MKKNDKKKQKNSNEYPQYKIYEIKQLNKK